MKRQSALVFVLALALASLIPGRASADSGSATYEYLVGSGFICGLAPTACPDIAMADSGDTVEIAGSGTFSIHPNSATGGGTFTHMAPDGSVVGTGTWTATGLASFHSYGSGAAQDFPSEFFGGRAVIKVHLVATSGLAADGLLTVTCELGDKIPAGAMEGIRLNVQGLINFNREVSGLTVYVLDP